MKLRDVLNVISGGTNIRISVNCNTIFSGRMADVKVTDWTNTVGPYLDNEVYRLNTFNGYITIAC